MIAGSKAVCAGLLLLLASLGHGAFPMVFSVEDHHSHYNEIAHKILAKAYRTTGLKIKPSSRDHGQFDGHLISKLDLQKERGDYIRIPVPVVAMRLVAYAQSRHEHVPYEFGLLGNRVAVVQGHKMAQQFMAGMVIYPSVNNQHAFEKLIANQVDIVVMPELEALSPEGRGYFERKRIVALQPAVQEELMYHYLHKRHQHLVPRIKKALLKIQKQDALMTTVASSSSDRLSESVSIAASFRRYE